MKESEYSIPDTNGVSFDVEYVEIDGHKTDRNCRKPGRHACNCNDGGFRRQSETFKMACFFYMVNHP